MTWHINRESLNIFLFFNQGRLDQLVNHRAKQEPKVPVVVLGEIFAQNVEVCHETGIVEEEVLADSRAEGAEVLESVT